MKYGLALLTGALLLFGCASNENQPSRGTLSLSKALGAVDDSAFAMADRPRPFVFPRDHGAHPGFRTEWWYLTGNVSSTDGHRFGYQFTIFRTALKAQEPRRESDWASNQIYMAHLAVTDVSTKTFIFDERFSREGNRLAGAEASPFRVWLEDWEMRQSGGGSSFGLPHLHVTAHTEQTGLSLRLSAQKPVVLQGDSGLSRKGPDPGNASYYYSYTRLHTEGVVTVNGRDWPVNGSSWMDREWSTSALGGNLAGWDWFALQLDDSTEIMFYQLRKKDGSPDMLSSGTLTKADGRSFPLSLDDVTLTVTDTWLAPSGVAYPSGWRIVIPDASVDLVVSPALKNQLLDVSVPYWEGTVILQGSHNTRGVTGRGYVELTGY